MSCDSTIQPVTSWTLIEVEEPSAELKTSLEWRRACARFRRALMAPVGVSVAAMTDILRHGGAGLARLAGRAARAGLPAAERVRLQDLRERIAAWLHEASSRDQRDQDTAVELWQELLDLAEALAGISRRPEMQAHDHALLNRARQELDRTRAGAHTVPPVVRVLLDGLFGRDDELDELLERRGRVARTDLEPILARLAAELSRPETLPGETVH
jgi:hypothetical protein